MQLTEIKKLRSDNQPNSASYNDALHGEINSQVADFLSAGGAIEVVPTGKSGIVGKTKGRPEPTGKRRV